MAVIYIDSGHQPSGPDTGAEGCGFKEQDCTLEIGNLVAEKLNEIGHKAFRARPSWICSTVTESLQARCDAAKNADYLISIHLNASDGEGHGSEVFAMSDKGNQLAKYVLDRVVALGYSNRGVKDGSNLYVIKHSNPVAILVECCFIDNEKDMSGYNPESISEAIVNGIIDYIGQPIKPSQDVSKVIVPYPGYYLVQKTSYDINVQRLQQKLNSLGYNCGSADGYFGSKTANAVFNFQRSNGLVADKIVGMATFNKIFNS